MTFQQAFPATTRIGLSPDELLMRTWGSDRTQRYVACLPDLNVLAGETMALVGESAPVVLERLATELHGCLRLDGAVAAAGGTVRIHAVQAVRVGVRALAISDPFTGAGAATADLALADLAGLANLGLTTVVSVTDVTLAARFADRVVVVHDGRPLVAYPVCAPTPRSSAEVAPVADRVTACLSGRDARPGLAVG